MIALGGDHASLELKEEVKKYLESIGQEYTDFGTNTHDSVDYPVYAKKVADAIISGKCDKGILICGTGIGISIAANKQKGIRAANCTNEFMAKYTRLHNDANVLCLGARVLGVGVAVDIVKVFLETEFTKEERHQKRIDMLED